MVLWPYFCKGVFLTPAPIRRFSTSWQLMSGYQCALLSGQPSVFVMDSTSPGVLMEVLYSWPIMWHQQAQEFLPPFFKSHMEAVVMTICVSGHIKGMAPFIMLWNEHLYPAPIHRLKSNPDTQVKWYGGMKSLEEYSVLGWNLCSYKRENELLLLCPRCPYREVSTKANSLCLWNILTCIAYSDPLTSDPHPPELSECLVS